ncbi:MAG TPA: hypothetical protein VIU61_22325 [Kofleriaceae bacterium]
MRSLLIVAALCAPAPADACPAQAPEDPFGLFDAAVTVVLARVVTPDPPRRMAMPIELAVDAVYKGDPKLAKVITHDDGSSCAPEFRQPGQAIYFLDRHRRVIAGFQGYLEVTDDAWGKRLVAWRDATTDAERVGVLIAGIETVGNPAASALLRHPGLLRSIDPAGRARLVKAVADDWQPAYTILVLARLRAPELLATILDQKAWAYEAKVRAVLAIERFVTETDPAKLAQVIGARTSSDTERAAALDRCEQLHARSFENFLRYVHQPEDVSWPALAKACAAGTAAPASRSPRSRTGPARSPTARPR